jgi:DNA-binding SARP family transcriptional activator
LTPPYSEITLNINVLGGCEVICNDTPLSGCSAKAQALLVYLGLNLTPQRRPHVAGLLWSELTESQSLANLRKVIHEIKTATSDYGPIVTADRQSLSLSQNITCQIDALRFREYAQASPPTISSLTTALQHYQGQFLHGFFIKAATGFDSWQTSMAMYYHNTYLQALLEMSVTREKQGDTDSSISAMNLLLQLEPLREDYHLRLMTLFANSGQRINAMRQYETCVETLNKELSIEPQSELTDFYQQLQSKPAVETEPRVPAKLSEPHKFIVGPPVTSPHLFFGRNDYLRRIFGWWQHPPFGHVALVGLRRSGKTSLLQHLKPISGQQAKVRYGQKNRWLQHAENYRWIFVDFQDPRMRTLSSLLTYLLGHLDIAAPENCTLTQFMDLATEQQWTTPTLILMDELEAGLAADELDQSFWWTMRALTQMTDGLIGIAVASHEQPMQAADRLDKTSPFFNIFVTLELGPLEESEAHEFIDSTSLDYTEEERAWILKQSSCWPCLLQLLCQEKYFSTQAVNGEDKWRERATQQLQQFAYLLE